MSNPVESEYLEQRRLLVEKLRARYVGLGRAVMDRFDGEFREGGSGVRYDNSEEVDIVQLDNPVPGGAAEKFVIVIERYGPMVFLQQILYSQAVGGWQVGLGYCFNKDELKPGGLDVEDAALGGMAGIDYLADEGFYNGWLGAVGNWPVSNYFVETIERRIFGFDGLI